MSNPEAPGTTVEMGTAAGTVAEMTRMGPLDTGRTWSREAHAGR